MERFGASLCPKSVLGPGAIASNWFEGGYLKSFCCLGHDGLPLKAVLGGGGSICHMAMGQNPVPSVNIPIPTKIGSKMGGALKTPKWTNQNPFPLTLALTTPGLPLGITARAAITALATGLFFWVSQLGSKITCRAMDFQLTRWFLRCPVAMGKKGHPFLVG